MLPAEFPHRLDTSAIRAPWAVGSNPLHPFGQPFEFAPGNPAEPPRGLSGQVLDRTGQDLMLDGALAFDVRAFDPGAPLVEQGGVAVEPSDLGWQAWADSGAAAARVVGFGAYADLAWNVPWSVSSYPPAATKRWQDGAGGTPTALFGGRPFWKSQLDHAGPENAHRDVCYDTWSLHYEHDGVDQADAFPPNTNNLTDATIDEGTNGIDDDNADGVDDPDERETSPPYAAPLTGVQVRLRVYEQEARQVRETSVIQDF
jgi:hypothetical protein